VTFERGPV